MSSVTCLRLSDVSVICRVTSLLFPIQAGFSSTSVRQAAQRRTWFTQYRTSDVVENLGMFLYAAYRPGNDYELIPTVKVETRHPVWDHLVVNFRRFVIIAELWWPLRYFSKFCSECFHRDTDGCVVYQILLNLADGKSVKSCLAYLTKNKTKFRLALLGGWRPKSTRTSHLQCTKSAPDIIEIGSLSAEV